MLTCDSCVRNCGWRTIVQEAVELKLAIHSSSISHSFIEWSVTPSVNWQGEEGTRNYRHTFSMYDNLLQPGTMYNISVQGE